MLTKRLVANPTPGTSGLAIDFVPQPFGNDIYAKFGDEFALPAVGNFDPPVAGVSNSQFEYYSYMNPVDNLDVDGNGVLTAVDALMLIDTINSNGSGYALEAFRSEAASQAPSYDVSGNFVVSALDVLLVFTALNAQADLGGEGEALTDAALAAPTAASLDIVLNPVEANVSVASSWIVNDGNILDGVTAEIAFPRPARDEVEFEYSDGTAEDDREALLEDLAQDIATAWSMI